MTPTVVHLHETPEQPRRFDGGEAPDCEPLGDPRLDLNRMARHGAGRALIRRALPGSTLHGAPGGQALYAHGAVRLLVDGHGHMLPAVTRAWAAMPHPSAWQLPAFRLSLEAA